MTTPHLSFGPSPIDPYDLTPKERRDYESGLWLGVKLPRHKTDQGTDAECAAELWARITLCLAKEV